MIRGWCTLHYQRWRKTGDPEGGGPLRIVGDDAARFWSKIDKAGPLPTYAPFLGPCWLWTPPPDPSGYGIINIGGVNTRAHRWSYEQENGTIPEGMVIDHLCRVRSCVNPAHLELVTLEENILRGFGPTAVNARKAECIHGHPLEGENLMINRSGGRQCRTCAREQARRWREEMAS